ncbi:hypothetical protein ACFLY5_00145 [Patescibacteria group bacterium]
MDGVTLLFVGKIAIAFFVCLGLIFLSILLFPDFWIKKLEQSANYLRRLREKVEEENDL